MSSSRSPLRVLLLIVSDRAQVVLHATLGLAFLVMIPVALLGGLKQSVPFVVFLSLWALVATHWSGALAAWAALRADANSPE